MKLTRSGWYRLSALFIAVAAPFIGIGHWEAGVIVMGSMLFAELADIRDAIREN